jgi:hypothetical protein
MNSSFGQMTGNYGLEMPTFDFGPPSDGGFNFDFSASSPEEEKAQKNQQAANLASDILGLVGQGIGMFSSLQDRKAAEAAAQAEIARAAAAGQMSQSQAHLANAEVALQLGLGQSDERKSKNTQNTIIIVALGVLVVGGLLGGAALFANR